MSRRVCLSLILVAVASIAAAALAMTDSHSRSSKVRVESSAGAVSDAPSSLPEGRTSSPVAPPATSRVIDTPTTADPVATVPQIAPRTVATSELNASQVLSSPRSYDHGHIALSIPDLSASPSVIAPDALVPHDLEGHVVPPIVNGDLKPRLVLASLTTDELRPSNNQLIWAYIWDNVPGSIASLPEGATLPPGPSLSETLQAVDAQTGLSLFIFTDAAGAQ